MKNRTRSPRYTGVAIALHWVMASMLLFMIWLGWNMDDNQARFQLHKSIGITILTLTIARVVWRIMNPPPPLDDHMPKLERRASHWVHMVFYAVMILAPLGGWFLVSTSDFKVPTVLYGMVSWPHLPVPAPLHTETSYAVVAFLHSKAAWLILAMLALHVAGALKHEFFGEEAGVLNRMLPGLFGKTDGPAAPARGFFPAFGAAIALFVVVAAVPLMGSGQSQPDTPLITDAPQKGSTPLYTTGMTGIAPNWTVDYDTADIQFSGQHDGNNFSGRFNSWRAQVAFYPENLEASEVRVEVDLASARTGTKLYDDSLKSTEWFDLKSNNQATVLLSDFKKRGPPPLPFEGEGLPSGDGYDVTATLILKGQEVSFPMAFNIEIDDGVATMAGQAILKRTPLNLGLDSDPNAEWVSEAIAVTVAGNATRTGPRPSPMTANILPIQPETIALAADILSGGGLVAIPTETVYGLACDASNPEAVARLYAAKGRPSFNPLIAHISSSDMAKCEAEFSLVAGATALTYWPGPLTLVLPVKPGGRVCDLARAGLDTIAMRHPSHPVAEQIIQKFGGPIVAPSANRSGHVSPTRAEHVAADLSEHIDLILDGGPCERGVESTIVSFTGNMPTLLRPGAIDTQDLANFLEGKLARPALGSDVSAPGQLKSHYATDAALRLNASAPEDGEAYLGFGPGPAGLNLSPTGDLVEAASKLFAMLRALDVRFDRIAVAPIPMDGLGEAINDRLSRAAHRD